MVVDEYLNAELADVPAMQLLTDMYDFMSLNANEEATDELIVSGIFAQFGANFAPFRANLLQIHQRF